MDFGSTEAAAPAVLQDFVEFGRHLFDQPVDPTAATDLLTAIHADRRFDGSLFLDEAVFRANPQYTGVNPKPGRNLLDRFEDRLGFVERDCRRSLRR